MSFGELAPITLAAVGALMVAVWLLSLVLRDASIVDIVWGLGFVLIATLGNFLGADTPRARLVWTLTSLWGLRLAVHLFRRNVGKGEDYRYQAMRRRWGRRFPVISLFTVFVLQGVLMLVVSLPVQAALPRSRPAELTAVTRWAPGCGSSDSCSKPSATCSSDASRRTRTAGQGHGPRLVALHASPELLR